MHTAVVAVILGVWAVFWIYWFLPATTAKPGTGRWGRRGAPVRIALLVVWVLFARFSFFRADGANAMAWLATTLYGLIAVAVFAGFYIYSAFTEERNLARTFPDTYPGLQGVDEDADPVHLLTGRKGQAHGGRSRRGEA